MNSPNLGTDWSPEDHPPLGLLRQYQTGALSPEAEHKVERHLLSCEMCSDVAEGMALSSPEVTQAAVTDIKSRLQARLAEQKKRATPLWFDWRAAAAILVLLCSLGVVVYQQYSQHRLNDTLATETAPVLKPAEPPMAILAPEVPTSPSEKHEAEKSVAILKPLAQQKQQEVVRFTPPVVKKDEEIMADAVPKNQTPTSSGFLDLAEEENLNQIESTAPLKITSAGRLTDSAWQSDQKAIAVNKLAADDESRQKAKASAPPKIMIRGNSSLAGSTASVSAAPMIVGKVVSTDGGALPGVTVQIKGTAQVVSTDINGQFQLPLPSDKQTLVFSYLGFIPKELVVKNNSKPLEVQLQSDDRALSEVVVVGYGTQTKAATPDVVIAPKPTGGMLAFRKYIKQNLRYPEADKAQQVKGRVVVEFTVSRFGKTENPRVVKSLSPTADAEALRLIKEGPSWQAGTTNGVPAPQQVKVAIRFKLP
ncbi:energy transducer TonB [Rufibacter roseus]|uniref:TonB family protein n=1 Tax=Rufibacter roseus TaxID=1567108 RepID=A0ABW2DRH0_9BACT|nr:energy transducer TonB [Rufibacter roseus]